MNKRIFNALRKVAASLPTEVSDDLRPALPNGKMPPPMNNIMGESRTVLGNLMQRFGHPSKVAEHLSIPRVYNRILSSRAFRRAAEKDGVNFRRALYESAGPAEVEAYRNRMLDDADDLLEHGSAEESAAAIKFLKDVGAASYKEYEEAKRQGVTPTYRRGPMPKLPKILKKHKPVLDTLSHLVGRNTNAGSGYSNIG